MRKFCLQCKKGFNVPNWMKSRKFCSRGCSAKYHSGDRNVSKRQSVKDKISLKNKGLKRTKEQIEKNRLARTGVKQSMAVRIKRGIYRRGEASPFWKGGITPINKLVRHLQRYYDWRLSVFKRDDYTCQHCKTKGIYLEVHHIKELSEIISENNIKTADDAISCDELWFVSNGLTLCRRCHVVEAHKWKKYG